MPALQDKMVAGTVTLTLMLGLFMCLLAALSYSDATSKAWTIRSTLRDAFDFGLLEAAVTKEQHWANLRGVEAQLREFSLRWVRLRGTVQQRSEPAVSRRMTRERTRLCTASAGSVCAGRSRSAPERETHQDYLRCGRVVDLGVPP